MLMSNSTGSNRIRFLLYKNHDGKLICDWSTLKKFIKFSNFFPISQPLSSSFSGLLKF